MPAKKIEQVIKTEGKPDIIIRLAKVQDMRRIQMLYAEVYGGNYAIPLITEKDRMRRAIEDADYSWLVADCEGRIIASLVYAHDLEGGISKAFGAVVSQDYRKMDLAYTMMKLVLDDITHSRKLVYTVYATTRTANYAPQRLTESLGFIKTGVFPNTHKVSENETHCFASYITEQALKRRKKKPHLIPEVQPFYQLIRRQINLDSPIISHVQSQFHGQRNKIQLLPLEAITAPSFIKNRYKKIKSDGFLAHVYMPFHDPNLIFITPDQSTEVYLQYNRDKYCVIIGGVTKEKSATVVLESVAQKLNEMGMTYIELIMDAYAPQLQREAMDARYIPSGYYPCMRKVGGRQHDCVVFSRTFEILDFRNVRILSLYKSFLREYLKLWRENYIDSAFRND